MAIAALLVAAQVAGEVGGLPCFFVFTTPGSIAGAQILRTVAAREEGVSRLLAIIRDKVPTHSLASRVRPATPAPTAPQLASSDCEQAERSRMANKAMVWRISEHTQHQHDHWFNERLTP